MVKLEGVFSVVATPFFPDGAIDTDSLRRVVRCGLDAGVDGLTALGVTSEVARLSDRERDTTLAVIQAEVGGAVPVVVGATAQGIEPCIEYVARARDQGASAVMISPPRMATANAAAIRRHYERVTQAVPIPVVIQDYPQTSGFTMDAALLATLVREIPGMAAIKLEDPPTAPKVARVLRELGDRVVPIFGGLGGVYLFEELLAGGAGAMTGFAVPEALVEVVRLFRIGDVRQAAERFYRYVPLMRFEFQEGIGMAIRKEILRRRGALQHATVRSPAGILDAATTTALDRLLDWYRGERGFSWISA